MRLTILCSRADTSIGGYQLAGHIRILSVFHARVLHRIYLNYERTFPLELIKSLCYLSNGYNHCLPSFCPIFTFAIYSM